VNAERASVRRLQTTVAGLTLACCCVAAQSEDLLDIYRAARRIDPALLEAQQAHQAAITRVEQARAAFFPNVSFSTSGGDTTGKYSFDADESLRRSRARNWKLQVTQPVFRMPEMKAVEQARAQAERADARLEQVERDLALRVIKAYLDVNLATSTVELAGVQLTAYQEQLRQAEQGLELGTHSRVDILDSRSRVEASRAQRIAALNEARVRRAEVARITGMAPETLQRVREDALVALPARADAEFWSERARYMSAQVRERRAALAAAEVEVSKSRAEHLPRLDLVGSVAAASQSQNTASQLNFASRSRTSELLFQLVVPIFSGGAMSARTRETQAEVMQAHAQLEAALREVDSLTEQAYLGIASGLAEVQSLQAAREAARGALSAIETSVKLGARTLVDVLNAQQQLYTVERDLLKARHGLLLNQVRFTLATEVFDIETIRAMNLWFEPAGKN
jgi:outer membrane protein